MSVSRPGVADARRTVIKLGTRVLSHDDGRIALARLFAVIETAAELHRVGREVLIVSSGAVGLGLGPLGLTLVPEDFVEVRTEGVTINNLFGDDLGILDELFER